MILSKQKCCLLSTGVSTESQKRTFVLQLRQGFLATRNMTRINVGCTALCEAFTFLMENIYMQFDGMIYKQIVGIPIQLCSTYSRFILYCYERDFMFGLQKSKRFDLIDMFNDTSRYLDDILPSITLNLRKLFLIYIRLNFSWINQILQTKKLPS